MCSKNRNFTFIYTFQFMKKICWYKLKCRLQIYSIRSINIICTYRLLYYINVIISLCIYAQLYIYTSKCYYYNVCGSYYFYKTTIIIKMLIIYVKWEFSLSIMNKNKYYLYLYAYTNAHEIQVCKLYIKLYSMELLHMVVRLMYVQIYKVQMKDLVPLVLNHRSVI